MPSRDFYDVLGVLPSAEDEVVRAAYRALMSRYHPDREPADPVAAQARVREITEAYATLGDPIRRARYDRQRGQRRPFTPPPPRPPPSAPPPPAPPEPPAEREVDQIIPPRWRPLAAGGGVLVLALLGALLWWRIANPVGDPPPLADAAPLAIAKAKAAPGPSPAIAAAPPPPVVAEADDPPPRWKLEPTIDGCRAVLRVDDQRSVLLLPYETGRGAIGVRDLRGIEVVRNAPWTALADGEEMPFFHPISEGRNIVWLGEVVSPPLDAFLGSAEMLTIRASEPPFALVTPIPGAAEALAAARRCRP